MPAVQEQQELGVFKEVTIYNFRLTATGLRPVGEPTFEEWQALGSFLRWLEGSLQWLIGDWVAYGEGRFEEKVHQAVDATDWQEATVLQYAHVAKAVPQENRTEEVSFFHHREVADLPVAEQKAWLAKAAEGDGGQKWSVARLRAERNAAKGTSAKVWLLVGCNSPEDRDLLAEQMRAAGHEVKLP